LSSDFQASGCPGRMTGCNSIRYIGLEREEDTLIILPCNIENLFLYLQ